MVGIYGDSGELKVSWDGGNIFAVKASAGVVGGAVGYDWTGEPVGIWLLTLNLLGCPFKYCVFCFI